MRFPYHTPGHWHRFLVSHLTIFVKDHVIFRNSFFLSFLASFFVFAKLWTQVNVVIVFFQEILYLTVKALGILLRELEQCIARLGPLYIQQQVSLFLVEADRLFHHHGNCPHHLASISHRLIYYRFPCCFRATSAKNFHLFFQ